MDHNTKEKKQSVNQIFPIARNLFFAAQGCGAEVAIQLSYFEEDESRANRLVKFQQNIRTEIGKLEKCRYVCFDVFMADGRFFRVALH